jgi:hypothetical protein
MAPHLPLPDEATADPALAREYSAELRDAIAVVGLLNLADRAAAPTTGISRDDDLR